ncbi:YraN family protein [uncultured Amnibacterium sp.]|uniref:YraN family protein n=1 Tax=uncultured Amnibacterium sp. TaxID=1631851 RepID=UPI0035CC5AF4
MADKDDLGRRGEDEAAAYLTALGWQIVDRNWRCASGEIDIVAMDGRELVIVEVKTRSSRRYGDPLEGVDAPKLTRLCVLAGAWRRAHRGVRSQGTRIDLIGVLMPRREGPTFDHLRAAA